MIICDKNNKEEIDVIITSMNENMEEWQIISVKMPVRGKQHHAEISGKLLGMYKDKEGVLFMVGDYKIVMVVRLGNLKNYAILKAEIENIMPKYDANVVARKMTAASMKQIKEDLSEEGGLDKISFYQKREGRKENVFLIAEDDVFVRQTLSSVLKKYGTVHEIDDGAMVVSEYKKCNPDVALLDIHMPNKDGLSLVDEIMEIDTDAFIIVASADSVMNNIVKAMSAGAISFLTKPVKKERILEHLNQCITFTA